MPGRIEEGSGGISALRIAAHIDKPLPADLANDLSELGEVCLIIIRPRILDREVIALLLSHLALVIEHVSFSIATKLLPFINSTVFGFITHHKCRDLRKVAFGCLVTLAKLAGSCD